MCDCGCEAPAPTVYCKLCGGVEKWVRDDYGSLDSGGSYELYQCTECQNQKWYLLPD